MIELPGGYVMDADDNCYIIGKPYTGKKDGKVSIQHPTYYSRLSDALYGVAGRITRDKVASGEAESLHDVLKGVSDTVLELKRAVYGEAGAQSVSLTSDELSRGRI